MKTKICPRCKIEKNINEFYRDRIRKDGHMCYCKQCNKEYYQENKERINKYSIEYRQNNKEKIRQKDTKRYQKKRYWLYNLKSEKGCEICGIKHPAVLVFHHECVDKKEANIGNLIKHKKEIILEEISKCQILCANCHRILHWNQKTIPNAVDRFERNIQ